MIHYANCYVSVIVKWAKQIYSRQQSVEGQKYSRICIKVLKVLPRNTYKTNIEGKDTEFAN